MPAGKVATNACSALAPARNVPTTVEQMCMMWEYRRTAMNSTTSTEAGTHTLTRSLRDRSTSMMCSARSFGSASTSSASTLSSSGVRPRGLDPAIGNVPTCPSVTLTRVSGLEPTTAKSWPAAA